MKNHIVFKFLGVFLCALMLLSAMGSGLAILALAVLGLDGDGSLDAAYEQDAAQDRQYAAMELVGRYASANLGECPQIMIEDFYGSDLFSHRFRDDSVFYTIRNADGELLESNYNGESGLTEYVLYLESVRYYSMFTPLYPMAIPASEAAEGDPVIEAKMVAPTPEEETEETVSVSVPEPSSRLMTAAALPEAEEAAEETVAEAPVDAESADGELPETTEPGQMEEESETPLPDPDAAEPTQEPEEMETLPPEIETEVTVPAETVPMEPFRPSVADEEIYVMVPEIVTDEAIEVSTFVDGSRSLPFTREKSPGYYVSLYMAPNARAEDTAWSALRIVWNHRRQLVVILGVSLLLFAVFAVYLCCAAGRTPGGDQVRPGGFNRVPLDLYAVIAAGVIGTIVYLGVEGMDYLLRQGLSIAAPIIFYGGYVSCLMFVGFCFAFAAQAKTPGRYLWYNTLTGRVLRLLHRLLRWSFRLLGRLFRWLPPFVKTVVVGSWHLARRICKAAVIFATWGILQTKTAVEAVWRRLRSLIRWCGRQVNRFYSILPLVWQWLLVAAVLLVMLIFVFHEYRLDDPPVWMALAISIAVVVYAANSFGTLLESARRMREGDLESKVDSRLMVGGYREFADELNGLADVAMVAARKQLKSERMKTELITNVSHDIKTPLTSIINYVDLLQKPHAPEEETAYLEVLSRQSQRMKKLIDDLMEMSKVSTGNVQVDITCIDAAEAVNQALGEFSDKLESVRLSPVFHAPDQPVLIRADGRLLWRALSNVLSNAVKYALPGTRLYIDLVRLDGRAVLSMKNISREQLNITADELLERFVRGDSSRNTEGSGLGLNIAKSLLEVQHGQLELMVDGDLFKVTMIFPCVD